MNIIKALRILAITVIAAVALLLMIAMLAYPPAYVFRTLAWQDSIKDSLSMFRLRKI
jgi:hypothetical protein